jgi:hypothetical protein
MLVRTVVDWAYLELVYNSNKGACSTVKLNVHLSYPVIRPKTWSFIGFLNG